MLIDLDDNRQESSRIVVAAIRETVSGLAKTSGPAEYVFGCTLFGNFEVEPFSIGPVQFEPRPAWLARKLSEGDVSQTTAQRLTRVWSGGKPRKRKTGAGYSRCSRQVSVCVQRPHRRAGLGSRSS